MDQFEIVGGRKIKGTVKISGSKNAALPCLFATLLTDEPCQLDHVPQLDDIDIAIKLLVVLGKQVTRDRDQVVITHGTNLTGKAPSFGAHGASPGQLAGGMRHWRSAHQLPSGGF